MPADVRHGYVDIYLFDFSAERSYFDIIALYAAYEFGFRAVYFQISVNFFTERRHRVARRFAVLEPHYRYLMIYHVVIALKNASVVLRMF